jgi:tRNA A37 threonylcarbamoyladenosine synthetase subunit TsaC/SUA5/YrdC
MMLTKRKTAGIRVPDHRSCNELVEALGHPILSTSATHPDGSIFDGPSFIDEHFGVRLDAVIDGGPAPGDPSSVISLIDDIPEIIRRGRGDVSIFE